MSTPENPSEHAPQLPASAHASEQSASVAPHPDHAATLPLAPPTASATAPSGAASPPGYPAPVYPPPRAGRSGRGWLIGGSIAGGVVVLALTFGGGFAVGSHLTGPGHSFGQGGPAFGPGDDHRGPGMGERPGPDRDHRDGDRGPGSDSDGDGDGS